MFRILPPSKERALFHSIFVEILGNIGGSFLWADRDEKCALFDRILEQLPFHVSGFNGYCFKSPNHKVVVRVRWFTISYLEPGNRI